MWIRCKSHFPFTPLPSNWSRRYTSLIFFNPVFLVESPKWDSHITKSKTSFSLIEPQPLPSTPANEHMFHALAFQSNPIFAAPLVGSAFKTWSEVCGGVSCRNNQHVYAVGCLYWGAPLLMFGNSVWGGSHHWNYTRESWTPPAS